jgi:hypothetical protein
MSKTIPPADEAKAPNSHVKRAFWTGIAILLAGFIVEASAPTVIAFVNSFRTVPVAPASGPADHGLGLLGVIVLLAKELGVAFIVAGIIAWSIEEQARERDNQRAMQLRQDVANDAVFALYGLRHKKDFIKAVVETNLEARIVRENLSLRYVVRTLSANEAAEIKPSDPDDALQRFVVLEMTSSYRFRNVSAASEELSIRYAIALRHGPGPRRITRASYVSLDGKPLTDDQIASALTSGMHDDELRYAWPRRIPAGKTLDVLIVARCVKERSDNEVWGSFFPTMEGAQLSLSVLEGMRFGVRPVTSAELAVEQGEPSSTSRSWRMGGPLLRHNSLVFWWRTPEDDGEEAEVSIPVEYSPAPAGEMALAERAPLHRRLLDLIWPKR